jgi:hypothetical protein
MVSDDRLNYLLKLFKGEPNPTTNSTPTNLDMEIASIIEELLTLRQQNAELIKENRRLKDGMTIKYRNGERI